MDFQKTKLYVEQGWRNSPKIIPHPLDIRVLFWRDAEVTGTMNTFGNLETWVEMSAKDVRTFFAYDKYDTGGCINGDWENC